MPVQHTRQSRTGTLPKIGTSPLDPNWTKLQRQTFLDPPAVTTFSAQLGLAAGAPGANGTYIWQPSALAIYDRYAMVGPVATTQIRIPWDGLYDFTGSILFQTSNAVFEYETTLQFAPTSDSGFAAPVFANVVNPAGFAVRWYFQNGFAPAVLAPRMTFMTRGVEMHANDIIQLLAQVSAAALKNTLVENFDIRWVAPIPNNMINI
jgi:hypothetical protein